MYQKIIIFFILTSFMQISTSGTYGNICTETATLPCPIRAVSIGAQALYLKPSYAGDSSVGIIANSRNNQQYQYLLPWEWGFNIYASYLFKLGNELSISWYHLDYSKKKNYTGTFITPTFDTLTNATINFSNSWNAENIEISQKGNFGENWQMRFYGGAQVAQISKNYKNNDSLSNLSNLTKSFNGGGPRLGLDLNYHKIFPLNFYANTAASLLVGYGKFYGVTHNVNNTPSWDSYSGNNTQLTPELEEKLGIAFMIQTELGKIDLDFGWMWINYFNIFKSPIFSAAQGLGVATKSENFGLQGLYFGFKYIGNSYI